MKQQLTLMHTIIISTALAILLSLTINAQEPATYNYSQLETLDKDETTLIQSVKDNPDSEVANYFLAIHYYNQGVALIENMNFDADREELISIQDNVKALFEKTVPYAEKAYSINPKAIKTLTMLSGIYFGMNEMEKHDFYKKLLLEYNKD